MATCLECGNHIQAIRSSKKYCSTACKQKAYLKRTAEKYDGNHVSYDKHVTVTADKGNKEAYLSDSNYHKVATLSGDKPIVNANLLPVCYAKDQQSKEDVTRGDDNYQWIVPEFFEQLEQQIDQNGYRALFYKVHHCGTGGTIEKLNTQLKSILHQLLRSSYQDHIKAEELDMLHDALVNMEESTGFRCSSNYPYKKRIQELCSKWGELLADATHRTHFTLGESLQLESLRMLSEIGDTVKHIPFDTLFKHLYEEEE